MKKFLLASFASVAMALAPSPSQFPPARPPPPIVAGQLLVKFRDDGAAAGALGRLELHQGPGVGSTGAHVITVPPGAQLWLVEALIRNPAVEYAEPDQQVAALTSDE